MFALTTTSTGRVKMFNTVSHLQLSCFSYLHAIVTESVVMMMTTIRVIAKEVIVTVMVTVNDDGGGKLCFVF